jgi:hypothetical protein
MTECYTSPGYDHSLLLETPPIAEGRLPRPLPVPELSRNEELQAVLKATAKYSIAIQNLSLAFREEPRTVVSSATTADNGIKGWIEWSFRVDGLVVSDSSSSCPFSTDGLVGSGRCR